jgi:acid phosphatase (class A)
MNFIGYIGRSMIAAGLLGFACAPAHADSSGYLGDVTLTYVVPRAPSNSSADGQKDLLAVKAAQNADLARKTEAFEDAGAYAYDQLLPRFSLAAGTNLTIANHPILGHMLKMLLADNNKFVGNAKYSDLKGAGTPGNKRMRPYREDSSIIPCETDYLYGSDASSYPSGHAANGIVAALLLSAVMTPAPDEPDRRPLIMARGIRYGENRVVCGVHNPSDVRAGQELGQHIFDQAAGTDQYQYDLICAQAENQQSPAYRSGNRQPYTQDCQKRFLQYAAEAAVTLAQDRIANDPFNPQ